MAKTIMIQGTMSSAGKSLIAAGLCRWFKNKGYKTAPFKSQNMALNSYITKDGLEMGRAQVMQAEAAGIEPDVSMNPILLKPTNDVGSQVIVNGEVLKNMSAREYFAYKKQLIPDILKAFHKLEETYDVIVLEGAGSPAEINLKEDDIVNMGMAKLVDAPVLLVGDIDRGGVFAQLIGTVMLLEEDEKQRIKGLIVNKFRGDKTILDPGILMLEEKAGIDVIGVVPYMHLDLEDEDSLTERFTNKPSHGLIDIVVIKTPRISNFTDMNALEIIEGISVRYVERVKDFKNPDVVILPGTKNTTEDLLWMRENGLEALILKHAAAKKMLFGICGGFQMLGDTLKDPYTVESGKDIRGMGLIPMDTVFEMKKTRTRVSGKIHTIDESMKELLGKIVTGYEIHMGQTILKKDIHSLLTITDVVSGETKEDGACFENVAGSYVHGIFDEQDFSYHFIQAAARQKGIHFESENLLSYAQVKEQEYDRLAQVLGDSLDMERICKVMGL